MLWLKIAFRYLFAKKSTQAINLMAGVAGLGVMSASAALIIVLSVFNGLESTILESISPFQQSLKISPIKGKFFKEDDLSLAKLQGIEGVAFLQQAIQEKSLLSYQEKQLIVQLMGYRSYPALAQSSIKDVIGSGYFFTEDGFSQECLVGSGIAASLGINPAAAFTPLVFMSPQSEQSFNALNTSFTTVQLNPIGIFNTQQEQDNTLCIAAIDSVQKLLNRPNDLSFIGVVLHPGADEEYVSACIEHTVGSNFKVENRAEQNATLYRILRIEKLSVFIILSFIAFIAIVNIMSSLIMLILEKQQDNAVLRSLGASRSFLSNLYFSEGMLIVSIATAIGLLLGGLFAFGQQEYAWIKAVSSDGLFEIPYPCVVQPKDFLAIAAVNIALASLVVWIAIQYSLHKIKHLNSLNVV